MLRKPFLFAWFEYLRGYIPNFYFLFKCWEYGKVKESETYNFFIVGICYFLKHVHFKNFSLNASCFNTLFMLSLNMMQNTFRAERCFQRAVVHVSYLAFTLTFNFPVILSVFILFQTTVTFRLVAESKMIEKHGGYKFTAPVVPSTFNFGGSAPGMNWIIYSNFFFFFFLLLCDWL